MPLAGPPLTETVDMTKLLKRALATKPNAVALLSAATRWTWRELERDSDRLAAHLIAMGLRPGDRVASFMPNRASGALSRLPQGEVGGDAAQLPLHGAGDRPRAGGDPGFDPAGPCRTRPGPGR